MASASAPQAPVDWWLGIIVLMGNLGIYFIFLIPPMILGFVIQHRLKTTVAQQMQVQIANGMTGEQVAPRHGFP